MKWAILKLDGDLRKEVVRVALAIGEERHHLDTEITASLPPNPNLATVIDAWQSNYHSFASSRSITPHKVTHGISIEQRLIECQKLEQNLRSHLFNWFTSSSFRPIRDRWLQQLMNDEVRVLIRTSDQLLLRLPWNLWDLIEKNPLAEVALSAPDSQPKATLKTPTWRDKVKILAILGNSKKDGNSKGGNNEDIDLQKDKQLLENLADAETTFLPEPQRQEINDSLWEQKWDILFFAGHSRTEGEEGRIYINQTDSLTITELRHALQTAINQGLQLAIFNSCDGMGLASKLQQLQIPQMIVMREPVPDRVAQAFLTYFLPAFAGGQSLYLAVREARLRLHGLEGEFPCASWLPVIVQNPATVPPTWETLGRRPTDRCPYRGLFAFREEDAAFFYGREAFTQTLVEAIQRHSLVSVIGASGSGKSSVVFAGLIVKLCQQGSWQVVALRPGQRPFQAFATAWVKFRKFNLPQANQLSYILQFAQTWRTNATTLPTVVEQAIRESPGTRLLIVINQFEELYTQCWDAEERQAFIDRLLEISRLTNVALVLTLRTDFLNQALTYPPLVDALQYGNFMLGTMNRAELQAAIAKPAALLNVTLEEGLTERVIEAMSDSEGNLPLLEFALQQLWEKRQGLQLTHAAYEEIGGLEASVARYAEQAYSKLNESEKERSRQVFLQLVRPGEGTEDTRRVATRTEIGEQNWELVTRLASDRLVVTGQDAIAKTETVELVHEALIQEWKQLRNWIEENRAFRLWQERLRAAIQQWEASGRDEGALLRGKSLLDAEDWSQKRLQELTAEQKFISASVKLRESETEKSARQRKRTLIVLTSGLIGSLALASVAGIGWWQATIAATNNRIKALVLESQQLFTLSGAKYNFNKRDPKYFQYSHSNDREREREKQDETRKKILFQQATLKAIEAGQELRNAVGVEIGTQFQVLEALREVVGIKVKPKSITLPECQNAERGLISWDWSADRKTIACVNYDGTIRLWDGQTGKKVNVFRGDSEWVKDVDFSPNGKLIASGTIDGTVKIWNRATGDEIRVLKGHLSQVEAILFSPSGQTIAASNSDGKIILWEVATGKEIRTLIGHLPSRVPLPVRFVFSPNGQFLASQYGKKINLWELATGKILKTISLGEDADLSSPTSPMLFSSNSQTFLYSTGTQPRNKHIRFWNISENSELRSIPLGGEPFFSPDGKIIATIDAIDQGEWWLRSKKGFLGSHTKGTVSLWNTSTGKKVKTISNLPPGEHADISFSTDSSLMALYTYDNNNGSYLGPAPGTNAKITFLRRNGTRLKTIEQPGEILQINFSPDNKKVAISSYSISAGRTILRLWDIASGREIKTLSAELYLPSRGRISVGLKTLFSPDGKLIAAVSNSGIAKFYDSLTGKVLNRPNVSPSQDVDLPPIMTRDGKSSITRRIDGSLLYRNLRTGEKEYELNRWDGVLVSAAHINNEQTITTVNWYGKLQERELRTGKILKSINLRFHKLASSLEFSPDGSRIAAAMSDSTVRIWDTRTGKEIIALKEYISSSNDKNSDWMKNELRFSPDGKIVAALGSHDRPSGEKGSQLELWEVSTGEALKLSGMSSGVKDISFNSDSDELVILKKDDTIQLWNLLTRQLIKTIRSSSSNEAKYIQFIPDSNLLFVFGYNYQLKILNTATEIEIASFDLSLVFLVDSVEFSSDDKTLVLNYDNQFTFENFDLANLLKQSCNILNNFQKNNPDVSGSDKHLCDSSYDY